MSLTTIAVLLSALGIPMAWRFAFAYIKDPVEGLKVSDHRPAELPYVMADRYVTFAVMTTAATLYRDLYVIAFLGGCFAFMALCDAAIYGRRGLPYRQHFFAGLLSAAIAAFALYAQLMTKGAA